MTLVRIVPLLAVCLCIQLSVCQLGSTSGSTSLWGKKLQFRGRGCVWQLHPDVAVPALKDLSVCILLYHNISSEWTGFVYKAPGENKIELGLGGKGHKLFVWLFGEKWSFDKELKLHEWCSVCLTWSGPTRRLRVYSNGTKLNETSVSATAPHQLTPNGTLTLGVSHFQNPNGGVRPESGNNLLGEIARFRMWAREWSDEEMRRPSCAEGDVLSWDQRLWTSQCLPKTDNNMQCEWPIYKITMLMSVFHIKRPGNCSVPLEAITREWLGSVFPHSFSVRGIFVSSPGRTCQLVNKSSAPQQPQGMATLSNSTCDSCFSCEVHVVVDPAAKVDEVQRNITAWLSPTFSQELFNLTADPSSISVVPAELMSLMTRPPPTVSTFTSSKEVGPTQSLPAHSADVSTTEEPIDVNETLVEPDTFFRVNLTLNVSGAPPDPKQIIEKWVKERLEINKTMTVVNLIMMDGDVWRNMEQYEGLMGYNDQHKKYRCAFHVQEYNKHNVNVTEQLIKGALTSRYENGSTIMEPVDLKIRYIVPGNCLEDLQSTIYGEYFWVETFPHVVQEMECEEPRFQRAYRLCKLDMETDKARWAKPNMTNCTPLVSISDLANITVTADNVDEVVGMIQDLLNVQLGADAELPASELNTVAEKLKQVVDVGTIEPPLAGDIVGVVADILLSETDMAPVANIVLNLTDKMGNNMDFPGESISLTAPALALSMVNVDPDGFWGLTFGVSSMSVSQRPKIFLNQSFENESLPDTAATISLPSALGSFLQPQDGNKSRIQFQFYGTQDLFQDPQLTNATHSSWTLNSYIVSASLNGSHVTNLKDKVVVTLQHKEPKEPHHKVECMFWDFQNNGGQGGWSSRGCETSNISRNQTRCLCDHLTHFAVLLDVSRTPISEADNQILTVISYLGCGISSIFLGITLLTYLAFEKLRRDHPSRILINLSAALFGLSMVFLLDSWLSSFSNYGLCIATAATLHYFFLASFTWMGLEAVHMYLALVKVFNIYVPSYILKICAAGWGIPLLIVSTILAVDKDAYGNAVPEKTVVLQSSDPFCWLQNNVYFYVTVVAFALLILLCNLSVFVVVLVQIRRMRANKPSARGGGSLHDFRAVTSLTVLLGLTWSMGFFSFGPGKVVMMYLFSIFNTLQGFFVFLFHCLMKENVRKQWRDHLCCGRYRPGDYSDWSRSVTAGGRRKKNNLVNSESVASDNTSTLRKVSDSSTGSAPDHHKGA